MAKKKVAERRVYVTFPKDGSVEDAVPCPWEFCESVVLWGMEK